MSGPDRGTMGPRVPKFRAAQRLYFITPWRPRAPLRHVLRRYFRPDPGNALVGPDQDCGPYDAHELTPVHRLLLPDAIRLKHAVLFIRGERDGEFVLGFELVLRRHWIGRDAEDVGIDFRESGLEAGEVDSLFGTSGRVRFWIEIEHELAPGEVAERDGSVAVPGQSERGSLRARVKLIGHTPSFRRFRCAFVPSQNTRWRERGRWRRVF